jgi:hypothetical protein
MKDLSIETIDAARVAIEQATTVQEAKDIFDMALTAQAHLKRTKKGGKELELKIAEVSMRALRRLGEILLAAKAAGQIRRGGTGSNQYKKANVPDGNISTFLEEAKIDRKLSSLAQQIATVSRDEFEKVISAGSKTGKKVSVSMFSKNDASKTPGSPKTHDAPKAPGPPKTPAKKTPSANFETDFGRCPSDEVLMVNLLCDLRETATRIYNLIYARCVCDPELPEDLYPQLRQQLSLAQNAINEIAVKLIEWEDHDEAEFEEPQTHTIVATNK